MVASVSIAALAAAARNLGEVPDHLVRFDGKRLRGAASGKVKPLLVAALDPPDWTLDQILAKGGNENGVVRGLIGRLDLEEALITAESVHCCTETARAVLNAGADRVFCCKRNHPNSMTLSMPCPGARSKTLGRPVLGWDETRTIRILDVAEEVRFDFHGISQIERAGRWRRDRATGEPSHETVYYLTSLDA